jgi:methylmalonyl-CoA mutase
MFSKSLSGTRIPKVVLPKFKDWGDLLRWQAQENVPGSFPFTGGVFPLKEKAKTRQECLRVKVGRKEPINVFIM